VSGRVQGVYFRDSCRRGATEHGVAGWVRNLPDRRVEAVFEGAAPDVEHLVAWMRHGPPDALVRDIEIHHEEPEGLRGFTIR
jgi:acylphosphatase